jgi:hypothetical protein
MRSVQIALVAGLTLVVIAIGVTLSRAPLSVAGTNSIPAHPPVGETRGNEQSCQQGGTVPQGTSVIRVSLSANVGPKVSLRVLSGSRVLTQGERGAGWGEDETVSVPVRRVSHTVHNTLICTTVGPSIEYFQIRGTPRRAASPRALGLRGVMLRMEYLRPGRKSWWSLASSVAHHMGLGHAASGSWIVFLVLVLMLAVAALASRLVWRELR